MKKGDIVRIHDGSYAMVQDGNDDYQAIHGTTLIADGDYEVIGLDKYPDQTDDNTHGLLERKKEVNDLMVRCVNNPERVVFTQKRFCSVVGTSLPK